MQSVKEVVLTSTNSTESWTASVWNYITGSVISLHKKPQVFCRHLQLYNNNHLMATDSKNPYLYIWPLHNPTPALHQRLITPGVVTALSCTSDGAYIVVAVEEKIFIYQTSTGRLLRTLARHYQPITCLVFNSDGSCFSSGGEDGFVFLWCLTGVINNYNQAAPYHEFSDHTLPVKSIYLSSYGTMSRLITVSLDKTARIYNASTGVSLITLVFDVALTCVCMDARESNLFIGCSNGNIRQLNLRAPLRDSDSLTKNAVVFEGHSGPVACMSVSVDCTTLLSGGSDGKINVWDIPSRQIVRTTSNENSISTAVFIPMFSNETNELKRKYKIPPFERPNNESRTVDVIEILNEKSDSFLLDEKIYLRNKSEVNEATYNQSCEKLKLNMETEKLKKINSELYQYAVKFLINPENRNSPS